MKIICDRTKKYHYHELESKQDLFSATQIRNMMWDGFSRVPADILEAARVRGTLLHRRFAFCLGAQAGVCDYPPIIPEYEGYCRSMDGWIQKNGIVPLDIEGKGANLDLGFAGQVDMKALYGPRQVIFGGDLKSGAWTPTDRAQLLLYKTMDGFTDAKKWLDVYLDKSGGEPEEVWVTPSPFDWAAAMNGLSLLKWRASL